MEPEVLEKSKVALAKAASHISELEKVISPTLVTFITTDSITDRTAYAMHKFLRQLSDGQLSLLVESGGGDIDATAKIIKMIRNRFKKFRAIVPYYAKSAATLLAVSADELYLCKSGELGPVDPQVRDPYTGMWIPAHSIKQAMSFIEESKDNLVKLSMADKMPPLLMGAFRDAQIASREYLEEAFEKLGNKESAVNLFLDRYTSHGYPIDREVCKKEGLNVVFPDEKTESMICDLHETYFDFLNDLHKCESMKKKKESEETYEFDISIIQSADKKTLMINEEDVSSLV
jgi:hypothetical protein